MVEGDGVPIYIRQHIDGLRRSGWKACRFHPQDPQAAEIATAARDAELIPIPDPTATFREIRGSAVPTPGSSDQDLRHVLDKVVDTLAASVATMRTLLTEAYQRQGQPGANRWADERANRASERANRAIERAGWAGHTDECTEECAHDRADERAEEQADERADERADSRFDRAGERADSRSDRAGERASAATERANERTLAAAERASERALAAAERALFTAQELDALRRRGPKPEPDPEPEQ